MKNLQALYQNLGYLFYSLAVVDKQINPAETEALKKAVLEKWLSVDKSTDKYGTDAAHYIFITFDYLTEESITAENAYQHFETYYHRHKELFTPTIINAIMETALLISHSFAGANKAELFIVGKLAILFKQL